MRFLIDRCAGRRLADWLRSNGHDVVEARELGPDPGDRVLLDHAARARRILVTIDTDFGKLIHLHNVPHTGLVRLPDVPGPRRIALTGGRQRIKPAQRRSRRGSPPVPGKVQAGNRAGLGGDPLFSISRTNCRDDLPNTADRAPSQSARPTVNGSPALDPPQHPPNLPHSGSRTRM